MHSLGRQVSTFRLGDRRAVDLHAAVGDDLLRLPHVLRIVLENVLRHTVGAERAEHVDAIMAWLEQGTSEHELTFQPERLLMHDTTCGPALVDIAGMRDALAEAGGDPLDLNPALPVDVSIDHSVAVDRFNDTTAADFNMRRERDRNLERFQLLKWAQAKLSNVRVHPPGTGILHTINLEQLATVVTADPASDWLFPDTLIGTDSHTPMINGLGVLGWGVGGLEAEGVMFGLPVVMRIPDVIGVRLIGRLPEGVMATDFALLVTHKLREYGLTGQFVEFFGAGVTTLSVGDRAVVANMAPEYGAQTAFYPVDQIALDYLHATGRTHTMVDQVGDYCRRNHLWFDPHAAPRFTDVIEVDLANVHVSIAGPSRPQDLLAPHEARTALQALTGDVEEETSPMHGAVAIAAITSCTNTSDPRLTIAAGLLARKARGFGLKPPSWVKTSFSPGSPAAARYLHRAGLLEDLEAIGFGIVGFGCMTCIGNSGPLTSEMEQAVADPRIVPVAVISGNRNFPGRVHPKLRAGFLASPPLVVAYALAGDVNRDITAASIGKDQEGNDVFLADIWPSGEDIDAAFAIACKTEDFADAFADASASKAWDAVEAPTTERFPWNESSTYLRRPPFTYAATTSRLGTYSAHPVLVFGDDITTDQISPAGAIPPESETGKYLVGSGQDPKELNVYASRRGNFEAMARGLFTNLSVVNLLGDSLPPGCSIDAHTGKVMPLYRLADVYAERNEASVIVAGERYGQGSSRDWAAKGPALLGVRSVLALSFERIHRTNLIGMGILPLRLPAGIQPARLGLHPGDRIEISLEPSAIRPRMETPVTVCHVDGRRTHFVARAEVETALEIRLLKGGGIVPLILERALRPGRHGRVGGGLV